MSMVRVWRKVGAAVAGGALAVLAAAAWSATGVSGSDFDSDGGLVRHRTLDLSGAASLDSRTGRMHVEWTGPRTDVVDAKTGEVQRTTDRDWTEVDADARR